MSSVALNSWRGFVFDRGNERMGFVEVSFSYGDKSKLRTTIGGSQKGVSKRVEFAKARSRRKGNRSCTGVPGCMPKIARMRTRRNRQR